MTTIKYAASGEQRKKLVNALSEILECESKYLKAPSYGYEDRPRGGAVRRMW